MKKAVLAIFAAVLYSCGGLSEQQAPDEAQGIGGITEDISDIAVSAINDSITKTVTSGRFSMEVPAMMHNYSHLDPESEITYGDTTSGIHLGVYKMGKKELSDFVESNDLKSVVTPDLYGYNKLCMANVANGDNAVEGVKLVSSVTADTSVVNGMKRIDNSFIIEIDGTDFETSYVFTEGKDAFYMIYLSMPRAVSDKYDALRGKVLGSFRENQ